MSVTANPFRTLVGLRGIDKTASCWVNDLPGLSTELVADLSVPSDFLALDDQAEPGVDPSALVVWESVHRNAYDRLLAELLLVLTEKYDYQPTQALTNEPGLQRPDIALSGIFTDEYAAALLIAPYVPHTTLKLRSVQFVRRNPGPLLTGVLFVVDQTTNAVLASQTINQIVPGLNEIALTVDVPAALLQDVNLGVLLRADAPLTLAELLPGSWSVSGCSSPDAYDVAAARFASLNADALPERYYLHVNAERVRSFDKLATRYASDLRLAYANLCGSLLMTEKLGSNNLSVFTLSNRQFAERCEQSLLDDFKRALRPVARRFADELSRQSALTVPTPEPDETQFLPGSYV